MADLGLPTMRLIFENATAALLTRAKKGVVGVMVRDTKALGIHTLTDEKQIPSTLGEANRAYVSRAFAGSSLGRATKVVLVVFSTAAAESGSTAPTIKTPLMLLNGKSVDYLAGPHDATEAEVTTIKDFVVAYREKNPTLQAVLPNCAANDRGIINYTSTVHVGDKVLSPAQYCSRIAGALAGIPTTSSCTNLRLDEVTAVESIATADKTEEEAQNAAIAAGQLIVVHDGTKAVIARGVNSYVTLKPGEKDALKKIKVTEGEGLVSYYSNQAIDEAWKGIKINSYDNRALLIVELRLMYKKLEQQGIFLPNTSGAEIDVEAQRKYMEDKGVDTSNMDDQAVKTYEDLDTHVFWRGYGIFADCMEDFLGRFVRDGSASEAA